MSTRGSRAADRARIALGAIRLINGATGIIAPSVLVRRLGNQPAVCPAASYAFRLFGVRTVLLAADLLFAKGPVRDHARRSAVIIHAADTVAATWGAWRRELPPRAAAITVAISAANTALALLAWPRTVPADGQQPFPAIGNDEKWPPSDASDSQPGGALVWPILPECDGA